MSTQVTRYSPGRRYVLRCHACGTVVAVVDAVDGPPSRGLVEALAQHERSHEPDAGAPEAA